MAKRLKTALTIAGSDSSGGAGIQADLKTFLANGVYGMSCITSVTAQNTKGVQGIFDVSPECLSAQLESVFSDIFPDAVKIGMISSPELACAAAEKLEKYKPIHLVIDPVMVSTSGSVLMEGSAVSVLKDRLFPLAELITPNIPEAESLSGIKITCKEDMKTAAEKLYLEYGTSVLVKGGHFVEDANDVLCEKGKISIFRGKRIENPNTHGTGCTLSSAISAHLALGAGLCEAISFAKKYLEAALSSMLDLGSGRGPLDHGAGLKITR